MSNSPLYAFYGREKNSARLNEHQEALQEKSKEYTRLKAQSDMCETVVRDGQKKLSIAQRDEAEVVNKSSDCSIVNNHNWTLTLGIHTFLTD